MSEARERWLSELYRASAREEPPASLDAAVLSAARRESRSRVSMFVNWGAPLAAAAVVVVTVSLVITGHDDPVQSGTLVAREAAQEKNVSPPPIAPAGTPLPIENHPLGRAASKPEAQAEAKRLQQDVAKSDRSAAPPGAAEVAATLAPLGRTSEAREQVASLPAASPPAPQVLPLEARERASTEQPSPAAAASSRDLGKLSESAEALADERRARAAAENDRPLPRARQGVAAADGPRRQESRVDERISPDTWLQNIQKLRDDGRHAEAKESLAAFKKRYPDYSLPDALKDY